MKILQKPLNNLIRLNHFLISKFGSGLLTVLSIMAFLLVCCGLLIGILGRGWLGAWFLVFLGLILGIPPCIGLYESTLPEVSEAEDSTPPEPVSDKRIELDETTKKAIELEAALARKRILEREDARKRKLEMEQREKEREEARIASQKYAEEQRKLREAKQKAFEKQHRQERQQKNFNQNYFKQAQFQSKSSPIQKTSVSSEFFRGVTTSSELKKRYLDLVKIYHPDNAAGDSDMMKKLQIEYQELSTFFESYEKHHRG